MDAGDFGFVGGAYEAPDMYQDSQRCINWYVEVSANGASKTPTALLGTPGLDRILNFGLISDDIAVPYSGGHRGAWVLPGGTTALYVVGNRLFLVTMIVPATSSSIAQFRVGLATGGTLLTNSGPVCIRDNGNGGYAVIVDGPNGYLYNIATNTMTLIVDPAFYGADRVAFIDGWWIFNKPGTQIFYTNAPTPYTTTFAGAFFALKDSNSDNLITLHELNREVWLIGERSYEVWYNAGGANFAFSRVAGVSPNVGCAAVNSICRVGSGALVWLARNEQGENYVVRSVQYGTEVISTPAINKAIASYPLVSDAYAMSYEEDGHVFYVLTFPTADKTWVFDATVPAEYAWHQRASYDNNGTPHCWKVGTLVNFQNIRIGGDRASQNGYQVSRQFFTEYDTPLISSRRCPHIWSREDRKRIFAAALQIEFAPGVGAATGQGVNPQAMLRVSYDYGATFGTQYFMSVGRQGEFKNRCIRRKLSVGRDIVFEVTFSDPTNRDVIGATLTGSREESEAA